MYVIGVPVCDSFTRLDYDEAVVSDQNDCNIDSGTSSSILKCRVICIIL